MDTVAIVLIYYRTGEHVKTTVEKDLSSQDHRRVDI